MTLWEAAYDPPSRSEEEDERGIQSPLLGEARREANARMTALLGPLGLPDHVDCERCGERCDVCGERTCAEYGPEPAIACEAHHECTDCHADNGCSECRDARRRSD